MNFKIKKLPFIVLIIVLAIGIYLITSDTEDPKNNQRTEVNLNYDENGAFLMAVEDVFTFREEVIVTGTIERGTINVGDEIQIIGFDKEILTVKIGSIEKDRDYHNSAKIGDKVGLLLKGITRDQVERGQVLAEPNSILEIKKFDADVYVLTEEESGKKGPFENKYRPQFYFRTFDVTGEFEFQSGVTSVNLGENTNITVELTKSFAMEVGTQFTIKDGGRIVGEGIVTKIYE